MSNKHTQGQWKSNMQPEMNFRIGAYIPGAGCIGLVATVEDNNQIYFEQAEANAKLIAAAPELLEALQNLHTIVMQLDNRLIFDNGENAEIVAKAKSAIKKATL